MYEVYHPEKKSNKQCYHVNVLKEWKDRLDQSPEKDLLAQKVDREEEEEIGPLGHLKPEKVAELHQVFQKVPSILSPKPGKRILVEHVVGLKDG